MNPEKNELSKTYLELKKNIFEKYYSYLNDMQRQAVFYVNGPLLVLAGAGTGKTKVLVERISYLLRFGNAYHSSYIPKDLSIEKIEEMKKVYSENIIDEKYLDNFVSYPPNPYNILAITFTNKAANEMKTRLQTKLGEESVNNIWAGTFHSMCLRILRSNSDKTGFSNNFVIYDELDSKKIIEDIMKDIVLIDGKITVNNVRKEISNAKNNLVSPEDFDAKVGNDSNAQLISSIYASYRDRLKANQALDFDDIIFYTVKLLRENEDIRTHYQNKFKYIFIDEFQDTNYAQFEFVRILAGGYNNIMVVGDDDQSIYKFRGANIENILHFDDKFKDVKEIKLEKNYRSTSNILGAANSVIRHNFSRRGKNLWTDSGNGEKVYIKQVENQDDEGKFIRNTIASTIIRDKRNYNDFAILYRTNAQSRPIEEVFLKSGVPYRILGGHKFYERKEVKDIIAYLSVVSNPDDNFHVERIVNVPKRKIGESTIDTVKTVSDYENKSYYYIMSHTEEFNAVQKLKSKFDVFVDLIADLKMSTVSCSVSEIVEMVIEKTGYIDYLDDEGDQESKSRIENVEELISVAREYEDKHETPSLEGFLEEVSLISDVDNYDENADAVVLMTVHSAKGLEFPYVFIPGMEEKVFPSYLSIDSEEQVEEERRLCYVAITRAKERCYMIFTSTRTLYGRTEYSSQSRFIGEIDDEFKTMDVEKPKPRVGEVTYMTKPRHMNISNELSSKTEYSGKNKTSIGLVTGDRVKHMLFGLGTIISTKELGADTLIEINFDKSGKKLLMATYAKLTKVEE